MKYKLKLVFSFLGLALFLIFITWYSYSFFTSPVFLHNGEYPYSIVESGDTYPSWTGIVFVYASSSPLSGCIVFQTIFLDSSSTVYCGRYQVVKNY